MCVRGGGVGSGTHDWFAVLPLLLVILLLHVSRRAPPLVLSPCALTCIASDSIHDGGAERLHLVVLTTGLGGMNEQVVVFALLVAVMIRSLRETNGLAYMTGLSCLCACSLLPLRPCNRPPESVLSCSATVH